MSCHLQAGGTIELYFYGELPPAERVEVQAHIAQLRRMPRRARRPVRDPRRARGPARRGHAAGRRLVGLHDPAQHADRPRRSGRDHGSAGERGRDLLAAAGRAVSRRGRRAGARHHFCGRAAEAAVRERRRPRHAIVQSEPVAAPVVRAAIPRGRRPGAGVVSDQHFERSKLVVLGLATKDARQADWDYERELAGSLLNDTRLYRLAAEERGMQSLAGVMRDLELVLLQTSMSEQRDAASLEQLQRLIRRRDLITKMEIVHAGEAGCETSATCHVRRATCETRLRLRTRGPADLEVAMKSIGVAAVVVGLVVGAAQRRGGVRARGLAAAGARQGPDFRRAVDRRDSGTARGRERSEGTEQGRGALLAGAQPESGRRPRRGRREHPQAAGGLSEEPLEAAGGVA